ncbi:MAG TPA: hypothetical protein VHE30_20315 [Polyangiaceae bacterium]|nr:hypothetical protein [Polyangiaceae bacterium]
MKPRFLAPALGFLTLCCGGGPITHRYVDTEVGVTDAYGAPQGTEYSATAETEREVIRITVLERSHCDKLKMKVISRVDQSVRGDKVVSQEPAKQMQLPAGKDGTVPCNERWARNVWVGLQVGTETYRLGMPSPLGEVRANLAGKLQQSLYADGAPSEATVVVNGVPAGKVSLAGFQSHETRVAVLSDELKAILGKDDAAITKDDISRSYELYEMLNRLDTGDDARIAGLRVRFMELLYQRKQKEATEHLKRNLKALDEAKGLLGTIGQGLLPPYVLSAVQGGLTSPEALFWARGEAALAVRNFPALCGSPFTWNALSPSAYPPVTRLAFSYLRFAYDDPFQTEVRGLCARR